MPNLHDERDPLAEITTEYNSEISFYHNGKWKHDKKNRSFISCDTETYTPEGKERQNVMLFGFGTGDPLDRVSGRNVNSMQMLHMIRRVALKNPHAIFFGFGFDFDVNFIVKDLPLNIVVLILKKQIGVWWNGFRFEFLRKKFFRISGGSKKSPNRWSMTIYEVQGFFSNASLLNAYKDQIGEDKDYLYVQHGKGLRDVFSYEELDTLVIPYWIVEQRMYIKLMERMRQLILDANLPLPRDWYGPSAIISRVYEQQKLKQHLRSDRNEVLDDEYIRACQRGYFGGRFEQFQGGYHNGTVYQYDKVSAYPAAMLTLWSWKSARAYWVSGDSLMRRAPMPTHYKYSVWDIRYIYTGNDEDVVPMPFPHRLKSGSVLFPHATETTVWSPEMELHWQNDDVEILGGWVIECNHEFVPFEFYADLFKQRTDLKARGNPAQYAIKIAINAGYGKVAQRVGGVVDKDGWRLPPYHQLDWAGYITSHCRANIWRTISCIGWKHIISVETDGIFSTKPLTQNIFPSMHCTQPFAIGKQLGQWEETVWDGGVFIQSGIYWLRSSDGWTKGKLRGLRRLGTRGVTGSEALAYLHRYFRDGRATMESESTQFHGVGHCLRPNWLSWSRKPKQITFAGTGKRQHMFTGDNPGYRLVHLTNKSVLFDEALDKSQPHPLPWSEYGNLANKVEYDEIDTQLIMEVGYDD